MSGEGTRKWRSVTRGVISPEVRAARQARMTAAAAETAAARAKIRAIDLTGSPEGNYQVDGSDPQPRQAPHGDDAPS